MSKNVILNDSTGEQLAPATTADQVQWDDSTNLRQKFNDMESGITVYVTPEMFGAVGDGVTDDTEAFQSAIDAGKPIICNEKANYYFTGKLIVPSNTLLFDGALATFTNFQIDINTKDGGTTQSGGNYDSWCNSMKNMKFRVKGTAPSYGIMVCGPILLDNISIFDYDVFLKTGYFYIDYIFAKEITHLRINTSGDYVTFNLGGFGDKTIFERCHNIFVKANGRQPVTFTQCLNGGITLTGSMAVFNECHFESFSYELDSTSYIAFNNCWMMSAVAFPKAKSRYSDCAFVVNSISPNVSNDYLNMDTDGCSIWINPSGTIGYGVRIKLDDYKNTELLNHVVSTQKCYEYNSIGGDINFQGDAGDYVYTVYPSLSKTDINGFSLTYNVTTIELTLSNTGTPLLLTVPKQFPNMYMHIYRKNPDGTYVKAVTLSKTYHQRDCGNHINGILWTNVDGLPTVQANHPIAYGNGVYFIDRTYPVNNNLNGDDLVIVPIT